MTPTSSVLQQSGAARHVSECLFELRPHLHQQQRVLEIGQREPGHVRRNRAGELAVIPREQSPSRTPRRPTVLPIDRKKIVDDVAAPMRSGGATFCTASVYNPAAAVPFRKPAITMADATYSPRGRRVHACEENHSDGDQDRPDDPTVLYSPVREIVCPPTMLATTTPMSSGVSRLPDCVARHAEDALHEQRQVDDGSEHADAEHERRQRADGNHRLAGKNSAE